jgi:hypothetical protein
MEISLLVQETTAPTTLSFRAESLMGGIHSDKKERLLRVETLTKRTNQGDEEKK